MSLKIVYADLRYAESFNFAVKSVAEEKLFLAATGGFSIESTIAFLENVIKNNYPQFFAINKNDEVAGWIDITPKSIKEFSHVGVLGMGVIKEERGNGLGSILMEKALSHAKNIKLEKVELEVFASNKNAIRLYKKFGFKKEGIRAKERKLDGVYDDVILMGKFL